MKKTTTKVLSVFLCLLMVISAFAAIPMGAEEAEESQTTTDSNILWSVNFDDYDEYVENNEGATVATYLASKGINKNGGAVTVSDGKLTNNKSVFFHDAKATDTFRDLFYGLYTDGNGNALTDYYMTVNYTLVTPNENYTKPQSLGTATVGGDTVKYTIYSPYRGESYFNPYIGGQPYDDWLFKVSSTGYLYTSDMASSVNFKTADGANTNIDRFVYTKTVNGSNTIVKQPITQEVWEEIKEIYGSGLSYSFDKTCTGNNGYQLEIGKEYTIKIKFSVAGDKTVTATTYVKPANSAETYTRVGKVDYKCNNTGEKAQAIRFSENQHLFRFDNIAFSKIGVCEGEHVFPTVTGSYSNTNGFEEYSTMKCLACNAEWYSYSAQNAVQNYDFTTMDAAGFAAFKASGDYKSNTANMALSEGTGLSFSGGSGQGGPELQLYTPIYSKDTNYRMTFTMKLNTLPIDQVNSGTTTPGSSFLTDITGGAFNMFLRYGRNDDYATTKQGWLKIRTVQNNTNWATIPTAFTLTEGETYEFSMLFRPADAKCDIYVDGDYIGTSWIPTWNGTSKRIFRIANQMQANFILEDYKLSQIESTKTYNLINGSDFDFSLNKGTLAFKNNENYGATATNVISTNSNASTSLIINDDNYVLGGTAYTLSFDFMMTDNGEYKDSASTDASLWSLVSWLNSENTSTKYGSLIRVGGIDNDSTKAGFEKFFIVMTNNDGATVTENNGNQGYTTAEGGDIVGYYSDHKAVFSFEAGEWVTLTLAVNNVNNSAYLYANGELVGSAAINAVTPSNYSEGTTVSQIRLGDAYRKLYYNWAIKDISVELTPDTPVELKDSGRLFNMDFGKTYVVNSSTTANLGSTAHWAVSAAEVYKDTATTDGYTRFLALAGNYAAGASNLFNLSMTSQIGDGVYYNHLDGSKYSIETTFALYDRATTEDEAAHLAEYNTENNKSHTLPSKLTGKTVTVIRMSKYNDSNDAHLIHHNASGFLAVTKSNSAVALYIKDSNGNYVRPSAWYTDADLVDGKIPDSKFVKVEAVVDESNDTFSVYLNDCVAYYKDGDTYKRAIDLSMRVRDGANSLTKKYPSAPESIEWLANPRYSTIPRVVTDGTTERNYGKSGLTLVSYIRFLQNALDFSVKSVSVTKMDKNLEYVGSQIRAESETPLAFDMRFVFGIDDIYIDGIEYDVTVDVDGGGEGSVQTASADTVYKTIKADGGDINAWKYEEGEYFSVFNVNGIELSTKNTEYTFKITPYLKKYNPSSNTVERNLETANTTHIIKVNGLGEVISYATESAEWVDLKAVYTPIENIPYKALGRTQMLDGVLTADWSAAGIEFTATCIGDVSITLTSAATRLFTVVVDGVEYKDVALSNGTNVIATNLKYGEHSFKIMNQSGYSGKVDIAGVTLRGEFGEAPEESTLLIEFIGDSITHGCGLGSSDYTSGTNDGTLTYAFLAAKELGADYTIMANGGMGVMWGGDYDTTNVNRSMQKYPYLNDTHRAGIDYTGYTRTADIVVIGLSTNDNFRFQIQYNAEKSAFLADNPEATDSELSEHMNTWKADKLAELGTELELLIAEIEANHGKDVPIILARGMMERTLANDYPNADTEQEIAAANADIELYHTSVTYMTDLIENVWNGKYGDHVIKVAHLTPSRTGCEGHPTREGAAVQGADLAKFIKTEFPDLVPAN